MPISTLFVATLPAMIAGSAVASGLPTASSKPPPQTYEERNIQKRPYDCHRDVRTHRINGVMVTHRHVGDRCKVRVVQKMNSF
jgi:hypothetical protein